MNARGNRADDVGESRFSDNDADNGPSHGAWRCILATLLGVSCATGLTVGCDDTRTTDPPRDRPAVEIEDGDVDVNAPGVRVRVRDDRTDDRGGVDVDIDD